MSQDCDIICENLASLLDALTTMHQMIRID